jgi:hypothetical protein
MATNPERTTTMTITRVFSGLLSNLVVTDGIAAATLTHSFRERERATPIEIAADVMVRITDLAEGPTALYGELKDGVLTVLGPDLRRKTLAAARPRGEMGPPAPASLTAEIRSLESFVSRATGKTYLKGSLALADGATKTFLVRGALAESLPVTLTGTHVVLRAVVLGDTVEVLGFEGPVAQKRALSREQMDARNARARERRAAKKVVA